MSRATEITLDDIVKAFRKWHHLPDPGVVYVVLAAYVANKMPGPPVWLLVVGAPSGGKTETLLMLSGLQDIHVVSTLTGEAALLSGTPMKDRTKRATGGLLNKIRPFGVILCKDFTSILSLHRESQKQLLAALREVFDGEYRRIVGSDGGQDLPWNGKCGFIGACTGVVDRHHAFLAAMGERFVMYRLPEEDQDSLARRALKCAGTEGSMREELTRLVADFLASRQLPTELPPLSALEEDRLAALSQLVALGRAPVVRDGYKRQIEFVPGPEAPPRIAKELRQTYDGLAAIGVDESCRWRLLRKIACDCLPLLRGRILCALAERPADWWTIDEIVRRVSHPEQTSRRALEDLVCCALLEVDEGGAGCPSSWKCSLHLSKLWQRSMGTPPNPEGTAEFPDEACGDVVPSAAKSA